VELLPGPAAPGKGVVRPANAAEGPGELLEQLPLESVMVITSPHQATAAAERLLRDVAEGPAQGRAAVMGFDVEWVPKARPGWAPLATKGRGGEVCLLQLAGRSVSVIIDLCAWFSPAMPQPALLQEGTASTKPVQEVWQNAETGGQCMVSGEGESAEQGEKKVCQGQDAALCSESLGEATGFKFDRLAAEAALDDFLAATLLRDDVLKVGFGVDVDVAALCSAFPGLRSLEVFAASWRTGDGVVDIQAMAKLTAASEEAGLQSAADLSTAAAVAALRRPLGLSAVSKWLLGKRLDKSMQVSDWAARPLSEAQVRYAATDAACLCLLYDALGPAAAEAARALALDPSIASAAVNHRPSARPQQQPKLSSGRFLPVLEVEQDTATASVDGLYKAGLLGSAMAARGKGGVLFALGDSAGLAKMGVGTAEWLNAAALFVNIAGSRYPNEFRNEGRLMTWFASSRQVSDSPVLQEALAEHLPAIFSVGQFHSQPSMKSAGSSNQTSPDSDDHMEGIKVVLKEQKQQESSEILCSSGEESPVAAKIFPEESTKNFTGGKVRKDVLLFCRVNPKEAYVFMGRLEAEKVIQKPSSMEVIWRLADYDSLRTAPRFPGIISAAAAAASRRVGLP